MMFTLAASSLSARLAARSSLRPAVAATRGMGMRVREANEELPPNFSMDAIAPPPPASGTRTTHRTIRWHTAGSR